MVAGADGEDRSRGDSGRASGRAIVREGEANRRCETKEMTRSMMAPPLGLGEDRGEDFNHTDHGRDQSSWGIRPEVMGLGMEDAHVFCCTP